MSEPKLPEAHIYIDLPTHIDGTEAVWKLAKRSGVREEEWAGGYIHKTAWTVYELFLTVGEHKLQSKLSDLNDKTIVDASKKLVQKYIHTFRDEILENSEKVLIVAPLKDNTKAVKSD